MISKITPCSDFISPPYTLKQKNTIKSYAVAKLRKRQVLMALLSQEGVHLSSWRLNADGTAHCTDECDEVGYRSDVSIVNAENRNGEANIDIAIGQRDDGLSGSSRGDAGPKVAITAHVEQRQLWMTTWDVNNIGVIKYVDQISVPLDVNNGDSRGKVRIVGLTSTLFLSACQMSEGSLTLISWQLNSDGTLTQLHRITLNECLLLEVQPYNLPASPVLQNGSICSAFSAVNLPSSKVFRRVVTTLGTLDGHFHLVCWRISPKGEITRLETDSPSFYKDKASLVHSVAGLNEQLYTGIRTVEGQLKLATWQVQQEGNIQHICNGESDNPEPITDVAVMNFTQDSQSSQNHIISATGIASPNTPSDRLRLTVWQPSPDGTLTELNRGEAQFHQIQSLAICPDLLDGNAPILTVVQTQDNAVQFVSWRWESEI